MADQPEFPDEFKYQEMDKTMDQKMSIFIYIHL